MAITPGTNSELPTRNANRVIVIDPTSGQTADPVILYDEAGNPINLSNLGSILSTPMVLSVNSAYNQHVNHGPFWPVGEDLSEVFSWEFICAPNAGAQYLISEGNGGAHSILFGFGGGDGVTDYIKLTGNYSTNGSNTVSFGSIDGVMAGEPCYVAVASTGLHLEVYLNGILCGLIPFQTPRRAQQGFLYILGSDHSNFDGKLYAVRGFETVNAIRDNIDWHKSFRPQRVFSPYYVKGDGSVVHASFLAFYDQPFSRTVQDLSPGFNGMKHHGIINNGQNGLANGSFFPTKESFPIASWVAATGFPHGSFDVAPETPSSIALSPPPTPEGALIFDSFSRSNQNYFFSNDPTIGSTEAGSLGPQVWDVGTFGPWGSGDWGIQNGRALFLGINAGLALVDAQGPDYEILCDRVQDNLHAANEIGIAFRIVDRSNLLLVSVYAETFGPPSNKVRVWTLIDDVLTAVATADSPSEWTTLRIIANDTDVQIYCGDTQVHDLSGVEVNQTGQKVGITPYTCNYFGLMRWDNFTVKSL